MIRRFAADVGDLINAETGEWLSEFQTNVGPLRAHTERTWPGGHGLHSEAAEDNRHKIEAGLLDRPSNRKATQRSLE